ncbi:MAG: hypothetical protein CBD47_00880, partial [Synechococcus sp. TMED187]
MSSRVLRRTRKGAVAAAAEADDESDDEMAADEADDENGDELPAAPARNAAEALRAKADLAKLTVMKEVDPELKENAVHEQAAKWGVQLKTSTTREEGYVNVKRAYGRYMATGPVGGGSVHLGTYTSPAAAALAVARFKQLMLMQKQPTGPLPKAEEVARKVLYEVNREWTKDVVLTRVAEWGAPEAAEAVAATAAQQSDGSPTPKR